MKKNKRYERKRHAIQKERDKEGQSDTATCRDGRQASWQIDREESKQVDILLDKRGTDSKLQSERGFDQRIMMGTGCSSTPHPHQTEREAPKRQPPWHGFALWHHVGTWTGSGKSKMLISSPLSFSNLQLPGQITPIHSICCICLSASEMELFQLPAYGSLAGLETQTQNAALFERKRPKRKPWPRGKSLNRKKRSQCVFWTLAF